MTLLDIKKLVREKINQLPVHIWNSAQTNWVIISRGDELWGKY